MEKNTKILIGVGIAAVAAYFVYRNKSKSGVDKATPTSDCEQRYFEAIALSKKAAESGLLSGVPPKEIFIKRCEEEKQSSKCPDGTVETIVNCAKAPCPSQCMPKEILAEEKQPKQPKVEPRLVLNKPVKPKPYFGSNIDNQEILRLRKLMEEERVFADDMFPSFVHQKLQQA